MVGLGFSRIQLDEDGGLAGVVVISESGLVFMISYGSEDTGSRKKIVG
jgi:hypothetical protein